MRNEQRVLYLCSELGFPEYNGVTVKTVNALRHLASRFQCDLVAVRGKEFDLDAFRKDLPNVLIKRLFERPGRVDFGWAVKCLWSGFQPAAFRLLSRENAGAIKVLAMKSWSQYAFVVCDLYPCLPLVPAEARTRLLLSINDSHSLGARNMLRSLPARALLRFIYYRFYESRALCLPAFVHVVSRSDAEYVRRIAPSAPVRVIPVTVAEQYFRSSVSNYGIRRVLIHMCFAEHPDSGLVRRLVEFLVKNDYGADVEWILLGQGAEKLAKQFPGSYCVSAHARVSDHAAFLASCPYAICYERSGSGTKNRAVQIMAVGSALVCTSAIADGIPGSRAGCCVVAEDEAAIWHSLQTLMQNPGRAEAMGRAARSLIRAQFSDAVTGEAWLRLADELLMQPD